MKQRNRKNLYTALCLLAAFVLWTAALCVVDVQAIGPNGSCVGFSQLNRFIHDLTGVHMSLYVITDWLGLVPLVFAAGFALLGLTQWVQRKHLWKVDHSILALGGCYLAVMGAYIFFENAVVNYRPVLIGGVLEASYPSTTTLLVMCIMPTAILQLNERIKSLAFRKILSVILAAFTVFMVVGRLISGVHWVTDIIGSALLSTGFVKMYCFVRN